MKRSGNRIVIWATLSLAMAFAGCTVEEGETPPARTDGEYALFCRVNEMRMLFSDELYLAAGLREWLSGTTDVQREAVRSRFFGQGRIAPTGEGCWTLTGSDYGNGISFCGDSDAGLESVLFEQSDEQAGTAFRFDLHGGGDRFDLAIDYRLWGEYEGGIEWAVSFEVTDDDVVVTAAGDERFLYMRQDRFEERFARWEVAVETLQPLRWSVAKCSALESRQILKANYYVSDPAAPTNEPERTLCFEAVQSAPGWVTILRDDCTEEWKLWY